MQINFPSVAYDLIRLGGGMDQITPTLSLAPGVVRRASNFEASLNGGYTRIAGYERFDGRANPSDARYLILSANLAGAVAVGATVTGATSGATGKVIARAGADIVVTRQTGTFSVGENLTVAAVVVGAVTDIAGIAANAQTDAQYTALAAAEYRTSIAAVPGSGAVLGVVYLNGTVYAWRANAGATAVDIYKSTGAGWVKVNLGRELRFTAGTGEILEGATVVGGTSGATGVVARVMVESGSWGAAAAGRLILSSTTGTFSAAELLQVSAVNKATGSGAATQITLATGGRIEAVVANFGGGAANRRIYGIDGINRAFEFDGTTYAPISTKMVPDVPTKVAVHKNHLFLAFGHSLQLSAIGDPYQWEPLLGAGELSMNNTITNLQPLPGDQSSGAMAVYVESEMAILYGTSSADFVLSDFPAGGARPFTSQALDQAYALSDRGVAGLSTTLNFGNFATAALTMNLRPYLQEHRSLTSASLVNREKGQYRLFFSDGFGLYVTIANGSLVGAMPVQFTHPVRCTAAGATTDGTEVSFFGSTNGFVYRMDAGSSFDGEEISAYINLVYNSVRSPRILKRFRRAAVELTGEAYAEFSFGYDYAFRSTEMEQGVDSSQSNDLRSASWDDMTFDYFIFDGLDISPSEIEMTGTAENVGVRISSVSSIVKPFTINSIILHYSLRRGKR